MAFYKRAPEWISVVGQVQPELHSGLRQSLANPFKWNLKPASLSKLCFKFDLSSPPTLHQVLMIFFILPNFTDKQTQLKQILEECHTSGNTIWWREILQINLKALSYFSWSAFKLRLFLYLKFCFDPVPFYLIIAVTWQEFLADSKVVQHLCSVLFYPHAQAASQRWRFGVFSGHLQQVRQHVHAHHRWLREHVGLILLIQTGTPGRNEW